MLAAKTPDSIRSKGGLAGKRYHSPPPPYRGPVGDGSTAALSAEFLFRNRTEAGTQLGRSLSRLQGREDVVVIGIPRGGVIVAAEVARVLDVQFEVWISCSLKPPGSTMAIGSVSEDGDLVVDEPAVERMRVTHISLIQEIRRRREEVKKRALLYRNGEAPMALFGKTVVVVDEGIYTGSTAFGVLRGVARSQTTSCILAVPVSAQEPLHRLKQFSDEIVTLATPTGFRTIGDYYMHFRETSDEEVIRAVRPPR